MNNQELVTRLRSSEWELDHAAANAIERLQADLHGALAKLNLERVNHREEMDAQRRAAQTTRIF